MHILYIETHVKLICYCIPNSWFIMIIFILSLYSTDLLCEFSQYNFNFGSWFIVISSISFSFYYGSSSSSSHFLCLLLSFLFILSLYSTFFSFNLHFFFFSSIFSHYFFHPSFCFPSLTVFLLLFSSFPPSHLFLLLLSLALLLTYSSLSLPPFSIPLPSLLLPVP